MEKRHAERPGRVRADQPCRSVAVPAGHRIRRGQSLSIGRLQAVRLPHRRLRRDVDGHHVGGRATRLRARHQGRSQAREAALPRHRARHLHLVGRRCPVADAASEPSGHAGPRHRGDRPRSRDRYARPWLLRHGQHRGAPAGRHSGDVENTPLQARRCPARARPHSRRRLLPAVAGREDDDGVPRRARPGGPNVHRDQGRRRKETGGR